MTTINDQAPWIYRQIGRRYVTDDEWRNIKTSLKPVLINADAVEVQASWHLKWREVAEEKWPLREALPLLFERSDVNEPETHLIGDVTPLGLVKKQTDTIKRCNDLIAWLDWSFNYNRAGTDGQLFQFPELNDLAWTAQQDLSALVAELERCRNELMAMGTRKGRHHRKTHIEFWKKLSRIFDDLVNSDVKFRNQHKIRFLLACSAPYCPEEATDGALVAFVER
jgi:hypothetical protein